jgi:glutathione S-transferase
MPLQLFAHPFAAYCQKAFIAFYENAIPFELRPLDGEHPENWVEFSGLWPIRKFPVLVDGDRTVIEATIIIEHLQAHHPGPVKLIPEDRDAALEVRFLDRFFDNYVSTPQTKIVTDRLRPEAERDARGVADARTQLDTAYAWLEDWMEGREWASGYGFSLADCAAAPALFYADWTHEIGGQFKHVRAYRNRLNARPSFARAIDGARPYRKLFPLGAPDRD